MSLVTVAQTTQSTSTPKTTTTTTTTTLSTTTKKPVKPVKAKTVKPVKAKATTAKATTSSKAVTSSKATTSPTPSTGAKTAIGQPVSPTANPSKGTPTGASRGGATTDNTTNTNTTNPTNPTNPTTPPNPNNTITQGDAASALRDALSLGIQSAVGKTSALNGFLGNADIKIPFPADAAIVQTALNEIGMGSLTDNVTNALNHAAENAAVQATPIFLSSIKQLTFTDAMNIVDNSQPDAATQFLQRTTTEQLVNAFKPSIKTALDNTNATKYWSTVMENYDKIPFVQHVETDLPDYVTRKAISGLFVMVAREEANIRKNPFGTSSPMVKKVFGRAGAK